MTAAIGARPPLTPWTRFTRWFFSNFFRLLLFTVSAAQWAVLWWIVAPYVAVPIILQVIGPFLVYGMNRRLTLRARTPSLAKHGIERLPRLYYAAAFTCLFCALFLFVNWTAWGVFGFLATTFATQAQGLQSGWTMPASLVVGSRMTGMAGILSLGLVFGYGYTIGQRRLRVSTIPLPLLGAPKAWDGLRVAQISDIHIGPNLDRAQLERFVERVNQVGADIVCVTGDIADNAGSDLETNFPILARLRAKHGVFAILGNHDHYAGADRVAEALRRLTDFTVLRDETVSLSVRGHELHIVGLDDRGADWARGLTYVPQLDKLCATLPPGEPVLLLCHRPDVFVHAARLRIGLTLSGHTHGGQLAIPWLGGRAPNLARFITAFDRGLFGRHGAFLYVNCGLGVTGQRIRLATPREISVVELRSGPALAHGSPAA